MANDNINNDKLFNNTTEYPGLWPYPTYNLAEDPHLRTNYPAPGTFPLGFIPVSLNLSSTYCGFIGQPIANDWWGHRVAVLPDNATDDNLLISQEQNYTNFDSLGHYNLAFIMWKSPERFTKGKTYIYIQDALSNQSYRNILVGIPVYDYGTSVLPIYHTSNCYMQNQYVHCFNVFRPVNKYPFIPGTRNRATFLGYYYQGTRANTYAEDMCESMSMQDYVNYTAFNSYGLADHRQFHLVTELPLTSYKSMQEILNPPWPRPNMQPFNCAFNSYNISITRDELKCEWINRSGSTVINSTIDKVRNFGEFEELFFTSNYACPIALIHIPKDYPADSFVVVSYSSYGYFCVRVQLDD